MTILTLIAWAGAFGWSVFASVALYELARRKPLLPVHNSMPLADTPLVSVLVPARNEAQRILAQSIGSVLAQSYRQLEVIAVNDRSTDDTLSILYSIAQTDKRLRVIDGVEPPDGWLGKPYALQQALEAARGDWVLTIDADMVLESEALSVALEHARAGGYDILTLMPYFETASFWERVFTPAWLLVLLGAYPFAILNHQKIKHAMAFGGFSLLRKQALASIGGFAAVRAEIIEDVRLAQLLKSSGARYRIEHAPNLVRTRMQTSFREIWDFLSRGMFAGFGYSIILAVIAIFAGYMFAVAPVFIAIFCVLMLASGANVEWLSLFAPSLTIWATQILAIAFVSKSCDVSPGYALTTPLGLSLFYTALLTSMLNILRGKGVAWKERRVYEHGKR